MSVYASHTLQLSRDKPYQWGNCISLSSSCHKIDRIPNIRPGEFGPLVHRLVHWPTHCPIAQQLVADSWAKAEQQWLGRAQRTRLERYETTWRVWRVLEELMMALEELWEIQRLSKQLARK